MTPLESALAVGGLVAVVSGPVGVLTVVRGQSFAGHALADIGATGGSAGYLAGVNPLFGFSAFNLLAALVMDAAAGHRSRQGAASRDVATGVVLGAALGMAALFLHWQTESSTTQATVTVLFGSIFAVPASDVVLAAVGGAVVAVLLGTVWRPLLLSSVSPELAAARQVPGRAVSAAYLVALAVAVSLSAVTVGAVLSTALLIGPAATALRLVHRPGLALLVSSLIGAAATAAGVGLAWLSYYWPPVHHGWPAGFTIVAVVTVVYAGSLCSRR